MDLLAARAVAAQGQQLVRVRLARQIRAAAAAQRGIVEGSQ